MFLSLSSECLAALLAMFCCYMLLHDVGRDMMKCSASPGRWPKAPLGDVSFDDEEDRRNAIELLGHETKRIDQ
jgi:hypothetical protein